MTSETREPKKTKKVAAEVTNQDEVPAPKRRTTKKAVVEAPPALVAEPVAPKRKRSAKAVAEESVAIGATDIVVAPKRKATKIAKSVESGKPAFVDELPIHSEEERRQHIATLAYLRAESRGFAPGNELNDWLEAEAEYLARFSG